MFLGSRKLAKLSSKDLIYNKVKDYAKTCFLDTGLTGQRCSYITIARNIAAKFKRSVNPETIRVWNKVENWEKGTLQIVKQATEKIAETTPDHAGFLADLVKENDYLWRKAIKIVNEHIKSGTVKINDALFLLKFTSENKIKFEEFKLSLVQKQLDYQKNLLMYEQAKKSTETGGDDTAEFRESFLNALMADDN